MAEFVDSTRDEESENFFIHDDQIYRTYRFLDLEPTTDNLDCFLFRKDHEAYFVYSFWRDSWRQGKEEEFRLITLNFDQIISVCKEAWEILTNELESVDCD